VTRDRLASRVHPGTDARSPHSSSERFSVISHYLKEARWSARLLLERFILPCSCARWRAPQPRDKTTLDIQEDNTGHSTFREDNTGHSTFRNFLQTARRRQHWTFDFQRRQHWTFKTTLDIRLSEISYKQSRCSLTAATRRSARRQHWTFDFQKFPTNNRAVL